MKKRLFSALFFLMVIVPAVSASALVITFAEEAIVATDYITLGDLVEFDKETQLTASLATKIVTRSPDPGKSRIFSTYDIKEEILRKTPMSRHTLWTGSNVITVSRKGQQILPSRVIEAIDQFLRDNSHSMPEADISFTPRTLPVPFMLPKGKLAIEVVPANPTILKSSSFTLIFRVNGKVEKNFSVPGDLKALAPVVIATDSLPRGSRLTPANTKKAIKDLTRHDNPSTNLRRILGKRLKRTIRAHDVIHSSDVEIPPLIQRGQLVKIIIRTGTMHLSATGVARRDGKQGEIIRVRNVNSNKLIQGRVTAAGTVEVTI
ncbi:MAG: flagellar basal body P-ring formation chaperone FlgA [Desulfopila sp.]